MRGRIAVQRQPMLGIGMLMRAGRSGNALSGSFHGRVVAKGKLKPAVVPPVPSYCTSARINCDPAFAWRSKLAPAAIQLIPTILFDRDRDHFDLASPSPLVSKRRGSHTWVGKTGSLQSGS